MTLRTLGQNLAKARYDAGLTQMKLAIILDSDPATVCRHENNSVAPSIRRLHQIAAALHTTAAKLLADVQGENSQ